MKRPAKAVLHPGAIRPRHNPKQSQAHPGVSALHPVSHRNVGYQPLPRPLGLPPYHYDLAEHFPTIGEDITKEKKISMSSAIRAASRTENFRIMLRRKWSTI
jgi:hypothetical protein